MPGNEKVLANDFKHPFKYSEDIGITFLSHRIIDIFPRIVE